MQPNDQTERMPSDEADHPIRELYQRVIAAWNARDAVAFAACFAEDGTSIGFDGSAIEGQGEIRSHLRAIFADHLTGRYVITVREVRFLGDDVALLRAVTGMVPANQQTIAPQVNALQTLLATRRAEGWRVVLLQNTPAQYHGRPDAARQLTEELQALVGE